MENQFMTFCRRCGRHILMTRSVEDGRWIPCDPEIMRFNSSSGSGMYVNTNGKISYGKRSKDGEFGYRRHSMYCVLNRRNG